MDTALVQTATQRDALQGGVRPITRALGARYFDGGALPARGRGRAARAAARGASWSTCMRTTAWINFLYLAWAMVRRGLPPVRAVVNLRPWFTRPWRKTAQRGDFDVRFTYARPPGRLRARLPQDAPRSAARLAARRRSEDPFPALVRAWRARATGRCSWCPELFVWEKRQPRGSSRAWRDCVFGSPEAPGFLHSVVAFLRNYKPRAVPRGRAHRPAALHRGEPAGLGRGDRAQGAQRAARTTWRARPARCSARRSSPPSGSSTRRCATAAAQDAGRARRRHGPQAGERAARGPAQPARPSPPGPTRPSLALAAPVLDWVFNRIYDGIEVDEAGLRPRAQGRGARAPIVLCPSHKSHVDYLVMSWVLWNRGYAVPLVAAGANLSFFPLGALLRARRRVLPAPLVQGRQGLHRGLQGVRQEAGARRRPPGVLPRGRPLAHRQAAARPSWACSPGRWRRCSRARATTCYFVPGLHRLREGRGVRQLLEGAGRRGEEARGPQGAAERAQGAGRRATAASTSRFDEPLSLAEFMQSRGLDARRAGRRTSRRRAWSARWATG